MVTMQEESDRNIILRLQRRDETALAYLMEKYRRYLQVVAMKSAGQWLSVQDIEEVTADVFMEVWNHADRIRLQNSRIKTYMAAIATNFAVNRIRKEQYKKREINVALSELESYGNKVEIEEEVVNKVTFSEIEHAFIYLTPAERRCFEDYYMGSYEYEEICEKYDMTQNALRMTLRRAREKIKRVLRVNGFVAVAAAVLVSLGMVYAAGFHAVHRNRLLDQPMDEVVCEARYDTDKISTHSMYDTDGLVERKFLLEGVRIKSLAGRSNVVLYETSFDENSLCVDAIKRAEGMYEIPMQLIVNNGMSVISNPLGNAWTLKQGNYVTIQCNLEKKSNKAQDVIVGYMRNGVVYEAKQFSPKVGEHTLEIFEDGEYSFFIINATSDNIILDQAKICFNRGLK